MPGANVTAEFPQSFEMMEHLVTGLFAHDMAESGGDVPHFLPQYGVHSVMGHGQSSPVK
jgi:hypothetical protein